MGNKKNYVLVVAAHPDDEVLGCGGTISRHIQNGDSVHVLILAEGITSRSKLNINGRLKKELLSLSESAHRANKILGTTSISINHFPDNRMDSIDLLDVVKKVEEYIIKIEPNIVYTHHAGDVNIDHRITHDAVITACRPQPNHCVKKLLFFETASSTEWNPFGSGTTFHANWFVDISMTISKKIKALEAYSSEMREWPHARSIKNIEYLAHWRGASVGMEAAEAFILGRNIT
tara:strand:- start:3603 stop:4301 length:699 start_codon:yes stop_codon:yes gene_type:complete